MKSMLVALILAPSFAFADAAAIRCQSQGMFGPFTITVASSNSFLEQSTEATVESVGRIHLRYHVLSEVIDSATPGEVTLALREVHVGTRTLVENGVQGELQLKYEAIVQHPLIAIPSGEGTLRITQFDDNGLVILRPQYTLRDCKGVL